MPKTEIVKYDADDYALRVTAGEEMQNGSPRWEFSLRREGCLHIRCSSTEPEEDMHVCNPVELHRLLGEVIAKAREDGGFELDDG